MKPKEDTMGQRIKYARERKDLSQGKLAEMTDISKGAISMAERDLTDLTTSNLREICMKLGVSADYLVFGESSEKNDEWIRLSATREGVGLKQIVLKIWKSEKLHPIILGLPKMGDKQLSLVERIMEAILEDK